MSLGPFYDNISCADARLYFGDGWIYFYDRVSGKGGIYCLDVNMADPGMLAHEATHTLYLVAGDESMLKERSVLGADLFQLPEYRTHRLPVEYLPTKPDPTTGKSYVVRVSCEPTSRRAHKSLHPSLFRALPLVDNADDLQREGLFHGSRRTLQGMGQEERAWGICQVMQVGTSPFLAQVMSQPEVRTRAKNLVRQCLTSDTLDACVPDFTTAVIRTKQGVGVVLYKGAYVGSVELDTDTNQLSFLGIKPKGGRAIRSLYQHGVEEMALRLVADEVKWRA